MRGGLGEGGFEVGGDGDGARGVVEGELDVDGVAGRCGGCRENVFADAEDVDTGAGHEGVAEGESVDGGADGDLALAAEDFRDAEGDLEVGPCAVGSAADELGFELEGIRGGFGHGGCLGHDGWLRGGRWYSFLGFCLGLGFGARAKLWARGWSSLTGYGGGIGVVRGRIAARVDGAEFDLGAR